MQRYLVERTFPSGLEVPPGAAGVEMRTSLVDANADDHVTWVHSYVSDDATRTFCVYDAPSPEAIRRAADRCGLPVDSITAVSVLDPYALT